MHRAIYVIGIIIQLFVTMTQCQCPKNLQYFRNEITREAMGMVDVSIPKPPKGVPLHLRVLLSVDAALSSDYINKTHIELVESKEESIRSVLDGKPISYRIYFPIRNPIPEITSITLNKIPFCTGEPSNEAMDVIVTIEHDLFPPRLDINISALSNGLLDFFSNRTKSSTTPGSNSTPPGTTAIPDDDQRVVSDKNEKNLPTSLPADHATMKPDLSEDPSASKPKEQIDSTCGVASNSSADGVIASTTWPWLAVIFVQTEDDRLEFKCNGNLISNQHILTAAHCLEDEEGEKIPVDMLVVSLGRSDLYDSMNDQGSVYANVLEYKVHPDYEENPISADSDLALVKLEKPIEYTPRIGRLCLWMGEPNLESIVGKSGYIVGWREQHEKNPWYHKSLSYEPQIFELPIVSQEDCLNKSDAEFFGLTSNRTFCAGRSNDSDGEGPRNDDSGSGFVMYDSRLGRYQLRGIISISFEEYTVYVDIAKHQSWILQGMIE